MISSLSLGSFKAYKAETTFEFAVPRDGRIGLTVLCGQNNSGKSTPLNLLKTIFSEEPDMIFDREARHYDETPFAVVKLQHEGLSVSVSCRPEGVGAYARKELRYMFNKEPTQLFLEMRRRVKYVPSRRHWSDRFSRQHRADLGQLEDQLYRSLRNQDSPLGQLLARVLFERKKAEYDSFLKRIVPDIVDWTIDSVLDQECITYVTSSGKVHSIGSLGDGFVSVFRLAYTLYSSRRGDTIILDEPELSLHPEAQKSLYRLLRELSMDRQIILATHSPYMVNWKDIEEGAQIFRLSLSDEGFAMVGKISPESYRSIRRAVSFDFKNRRLFDVLAKEVFFRNSVVFCEGLEDVHLIEQYLDGEGKSLPFFGYGSGGASLIPSWLIISAELKLRAVAIFDGDERARAEECAKRHAKDKNVLIKVLPRDDIRDKHLRDGQCARNGKCKEKLDQPPIKLGFFDAKGKLKDDSRDELESFIGDITNFLDGPARVVAAQ